MTIPVPPSTPLVRAATADDLPQLVELVTARMSSEDAVDLALVAQSPSGLTSIGVVEEGGRIVATATLLDEQLRIGQTWVPTGQIELVAVAEDAEGRGHARRAIAWCHDLSRQRGHRLQLMIGIPNFYRQFGYHYAMPMSAWSPVARPLAPPVGWQVRRATLSDIPAMQVAQSAAQGSADVALPHAPECWEWLVAGEATRLAVAIGPDGGVGGVARIIDGDVIHVGELAGTQEAQRALVSMAADGSDGARPVRVQRREACAPDVTAALGEPDRADWFYTRVPDPASLLTLLAPELHRRAVSAGRDRGATLISFYRSHVRLRWEDSGMTVEPGGPLQGPVSAGGSGVPPEALGSLLLGGGAACLEDRFPDANLASQAELLHDLFPSQTCDLLTFYLA